MDIETIVNETIVKYNLINKNDKVLVALSGGKDSVSIVYMLKKFGYNVEGIIIDLCMGEWSDSHVDNMKEFCEQIKVKLNVVSIKDELGKEMSYYIKSISKRKGNISNCSICGAIKKWILNKYAIKLGADKIVTGHNLDDEVQNVLMNFLKGNILLGINSSPMSGGKNIEGFVQRVKPLFFVPEDEIRKYAIKHNFKILNDKCPYVSETYRIETRSWTDLMSDEQKLIIVKNFQDNIIPKMRKENKLSVKKCKICGQPSRNDICNFCSMMND
jgi:uncharacterized protein (TIGR00269 family)